jgi:hypothetical protein
MGAFRHTSFTQAIRFEILYAVLTHRDMLTRGSSTGLLSQLHLASRKTRLDLSQRGRTAAHHLPHRSARTKSQSVQSSSPNTSIVSLIRASKLNPSNVISMWLTCFQVELRAAA